MLTLRFDKKVYFFFQNPFVAILELMFPTVVSLLNSYVFGSCKMVDLVCSRDFNNFSLQGN